MCSNHVPNYHSGVRTISLSDSEIFCRPWKLSYCLLFIFSEHRYLVLLRHPNLCGAWSCHNAHQRGALFHKHDTGEGDHVSKCHSQHAIGQANRNWDGRALGYHVLFCRLNNAQIQTFATNSVPRRFECFLSIPNIFLFSVKILKFDNLCACINFLSCLVIIPHHIFFLVQQFCCHQIDWIYMHTYTPTYSFPSFFLLPNPCGLRASIEQHFLDVALADEGLALIISDRGTMDGAQGFVPGELKWRQTPLISLFLCILFPYVSTKMRKKIIHSKINPVRWIKKGSW